MLTRRLLWPMPWRYKPLSWSQDAYQRLDDRMIAEVQPCIRQLHCIPIFRWRDTALCSLYRMVQDLCARDFIMMGYECEYFWYHHEDRWMLQGIPDPQEPDPVLYALLASMVEALVQAFNYKLALGLRRNGDKYDEDDRHINFPRETEPSWTASVGPVDVQLDLLSRVTGHREGEPSSVFSIRNILAPMGDLYNL